jgi:hypothetical protein
MSTDHLSAIATEPARPPAIRIVALAALLAAAASIHLALMLTHSACTLFWRDPFSSPMLGRSRCDHRSIGENERTRGPQLPEACHGLRALQPRRELPRRQLDRLTASVDGGVPARA